MNQMIKNEWMHECRVDWMVEWMDGWLNKWNKKDIDERHGNKWRINENFINANEIMSEIMNERMLNAE